MSTDSLLDMILNTTEEQFWERRRQVKARGYPRGWTEGEDLTIPNDFRVIVLSRESLDALAQEEQETQ